MLAKTHPGGRQRARVIRWLGWVAYRVPADRQHFTLADVPARFRVGRTGRRLTDLFDQAVTDGLLARCTEDERPVVRYEFEDPDLRSELAAAYSIVDPCDLSPFEAAVYQLTRPTVVLANLELSAIGVDEILISETMRLSESGDPTLGLYEPDTAASSSGVTNWPARSPTAERCCTNSPMRLPARPTPAWSSRPLSPDVLAPSPRMPFATSNDRDDGEPDLNETRACYYIHTMVS